MGFRNPFRIQVDENDVAYITDYSPDSTPPTPLRAAAGTGRMEIVRHPGNYGWPMCYRTDLPMYKWDFNTQTTLGETYDCGDPSHGPTNPSRWNTGQSVTPPITNPDMWYSFRDDLWGTPCFASYNTPVATPCPRIWPELGTGGVGPHGATKYHYDPDNPSTTKFPPYYDGAVFFGEFTRDYLREIRLDSDNKVFKINNLLNCGGVGAGQPFECDNPMDLQFGADGNFYLLTYGDGFFAANADAGMYRWDYVKGTRPPKAVLSADRTDGPSPLTVKFSSVGSLDEDPGDSIRFEWNFGDGSAISTDPDPTHTYTARGRFTAVLTVFDSSGKSNSTSTVITSGNTGPTVNVTTPVVGGTFAFGNTIPYTVTVSDPEDGTINCAEVQVTFVLGHDTHGHAEATTTGCSGTLPTLEADVAHGGNVFGVISASYTDHGGSGGVPTLTTVGQNQIRQKHQEVEFVVNQSGTNTATNTDGGAGVHRGSLGTGDWIELNGPFNLLNINSVTFRVADAGAGRTAGSPLAAIEIRQDAVDGPIVGTANRVSTGGTATWLSQTFPIALSGTHELFLVFRSVAGGATGGNLFNLNWAEFGGNGVTVQKVQTPGAAGGTVPATLSLSLGAPPSFGAFVPGVARTYEASTTASVISTAGDARLSVADPSSLATGHLVNGSFSLPQPLQAKASSAGGAGGGFARIGGSASPTELLTYPGPVSNDAVAMTFRQVIASSDALRTGSYSKSLTFTLSTTTP
jgi:PKD repeat protein